MAAQDLTPNNQRPISGSVSVEQKSGQVTPPPPAPVAPTIPPPAPQTSAVPPVLTEKPQQQPAGTDSPPPPKRKFLVPKKTLLILASVLGVLLVVFLIIKVVLPRLGGGSNKTITWWGLWEDGSIVTPLIQEYESSHPGVKIEYVKQSHKDYRERLTNALAKGEGPDIFRFHNTWLPMFKQELDPIPASVMSPAEFAETFYPVASRDLASGGGIAGIPLEHDALTLFINTGIFDENGKTPPATWDDLRQTARELTRKDDQGVITQAGVALGRTENVDHWQEILGLMMLQNGASPADPTDPLAQDAITYFTVFSTVDGVWDATLPPSTTAFAAGKVAMYFGPSWRAFEIAQANPDLKFKTVPLPQLPKEGNANPDISYATYWAEGVWTRSEKKDIAWDFLKFLSTKESLQKLYQAEAKTRSFGEPYPRVDMAESLASHPILGSIVSLAPGAESWYLASRTFDGPTGINTQLSAYYEDAINAANSGKNLKKTLEASAQGISQVLAQYGIK